MTTSAYSALTQAQQIFYDLVWTPAITAGETYLEGVAPVLAAPVVKQITEGGIKAITDWVYSKLVLVMDVTAIKLVNSAHQTAYDAASLELAVVAQEKGINSSEYIAARTSALAALSSFTQFSN